MDWSKPGFHVLHCLPEFVHTHVHWVDDNIQPSHLLFPPSPPALNFSQYQGLFQWVDSSHQVARIECLRSLARGHKARKCQRQDWNTDRLALEPKFHQWLELGLSPVSITEQINDSDYKLMTDYTKRLGSPPLRSTHIKGWSSPSREHSGLPIICQLACPLKLPWNTPPLPSTHIKGWSSPSKEHSGLPIICRFPVPRNCPGTLKGSTWSITIKSFSRIWWVKIPGDSQDEKGSRKTLYLFLLEEFYLHINRS